MYDAAKDERAQVERLQQVLQKRRSILEQQREDIEVVLGEIAAFEEQCRLFLEGNVESPVGQTKKPAKARSNY